jgi:hypothetical protein
MIIDVTHNLAIFIGRGDHEGFHFYRYPGHFAVDLHWVHFSVSWS